MEPGKIHDDMVCQILQWLPVISLLRFKLVCRTWRTLIESRDFIKQHLQFHHYNPNLKDKNHNLICLLGDMGSPINHAPIPFVLTSTEGFEEPNVCQQLNCSFLHGYFPVTINDTVSYNGIICLNIFTFKREQIIYLWNPATKQTRVLPRSPARNKALARVGFGFDANNNDYKVVNLVLSVCSDEKRFEVYSLNTNAWRSITTVFPFGRFSTNPSMPFSNGTCFFWVGYNSPGNTGILCFDFCSEMFRSIYFPDHFPQFHHIDLVGVVHDKIACIFRTNDKPIEMWVFSEYGTINESWTKLYRIDDYLSRHTGMRLAGFSMNGNYIFYIAMNQICKFNVVTKEAICFTHPNVAYSFSYNMVELKESLVSIRDT